MSTQKISVISNDDPAKGVTTDITEDEKLDEILFLPSTGECFFLDKVKNEELKTGEVDEQTPNLADTTFENIGIDTDLSQEEKAEKVNNVLFDSKKVGEGEIEEAIKFVECIGLGEKKPVMVAKKFLEDLKDSKYQVQLIEREADEDNNVFKDYILSASREDKFEEKRTLLDKKLRTSFLANNYPKIKRREEKAEKNKKGSALSESEKDAIISSTKEMLAGMVLPEKFKKFIEGTQVDLVGSWEDSYSVWEGKRNWNNKKEKDVIVKLLDKEDFNQDDAADSIRKIRDLWDREDTKDLYADILKMSEGLSYTADLIYAKKIDDDNPSKEELQLQQEHNENRKNLLDKVKDAEIPPAIFEASVSASVMRMSAKASGSFRSDLASGEVINALGEFSADMALAEGKANMKFQLPDENGYHAKLQIKKKIESVKWEDLTVDNSVDYPANFHFDSSFVAPNTAKGVQAQLYLIAQQAKTLGGSLVGLDIVGHTDAVGATTYNYELGKERAQAVYDFLKGDLVGMAQNFQNGNWNRHHIEFMQAVVHLYKSNFLEKVTLLSDFGSKSMTIKDAIDDPDSILMFTDYNNKMKFEEHHQFLKQSFEDYNKASKKRVTVEPYPYMPYFREQLTYHEGYTNSYILDLLRAYRQTVWNELFDVNLDEIIQYRSGLLSKGEQELLIDTQMRNEANRRVVLKGYLHSNESESSIDDSGLDFGYFRMDLEGYASGYAGANIALSGSAELSVDPENLLIKGIAGGEKKEDEKNTTQQDNQEEGDDKQPVTAEADASAAFFAGVKAEAGLKALLFWHENEPVKEGWWELGSVGYSVNGSAGISAEAEFKIGYDNESGRFIVKVSASATLGIGGGGKVEFSVGLGGLWKLVQYVYKQIKDNDFAFVDFFEDQTIYTTYIGWYINMLQKGINLAIDAGDVIGNIATEAARAAQDVLSIGQAIVIDWRNAYQEREDAKKLVESINNSREMLAHATPEVKGRVLYLLTQHRTNSLFEDLIHGDYNHSSEEAAVTLIENYIVSQRDWQETFEHMADEAEKYGDKARPYISSRGKNEVSNSDRLKQNQKRMEQNEIWLKTYLLNDAEDWKKVQDKRNKLWSDN